MSSTNPKIHLPVTKDLNGGFKFSKYPYRVQLSGDIRKGGFWMDQIARQLGKDNFLNDFLEVCAEAERQSVIRKQNGEYPIAFFNLYLENQNGSTRNP